MDEFANGQYQSILEKLQKKNENVHSSSRMAEKMSLSNNIAVCKYLLVCMQQSDNCSYNYCIIKLAIKPLKTNFTINHFVL